MVEWRGRRQSRNVGFRSGGRRTAGLPIGKGGLSLGGLAIALVAALVFGIDPMTLLGGAGGPVSAPTPPRAADGTAVDSAADACGLSETNAFVCTMLGDTEAVWTAEFAEAGQDYPEPMLYFYDRVGQSGCGVAEAAVGPFYCPADQSIYIDTSFFDQLAQMGGPGDFAAAYVVAHEVGHHVQTVTGISDQVRRAQSATGQAQSNALQVRMELQADCYAGVFAHDNSQYLEAGDIEEAVAAANAIGDDTLQRKAQGRVVPDSFTHGTSQQRQSWFLRGYRSGQAADCDTFAE
ncbi:neutral zinc metallopeptidase [Pacificimonas flava]|uniref:YpfJ protein, zinc metalloprotease superfamily n=1 Tax=Pacificimonas flava TaxID=1234595 RepID=M2SG72_9SPHN|nr:neutral zinc metallopeptidase [Pacificimonas flava]EMD84350.1 YpfJ protein, zinc metalloprotease superfamily [Pacificimonas flava]MBB5279775.1 hypothetical protein [Pacificimonas flava]